MARFRILSLDGGGIRGAFSVAVLAQLEDSTGCRVVDHFDLVRFGSKYQALATDCALATAAAPTYFQASPFPLHSVSYVDGGVWANCPALVGVTEAVHFLKVQPNDIDLLSMAQPAPP